MRAFTPLSLAALLAATPLMPSAVSGRHGPGQLEDTLARPTVIGDQPAPAPYLFERALMISQVSGGVAFVEGCPDQPLPTVRAHGATLREVLDSITSEDPHYEWKTNAGVIYLEPRPAAPSLLKAHFKTYDSGDAFDGASAVSFLVSSAEVSREAGKLGLAHVPSGSGLGGIAPGPQTPKKKLGVHLHDVTLLEVLNAISRANNHGVWVYREIDCRSVHEFDISFAQ